MRYLTVAMLALLIGSGGAFAQNFPPKHFFRTVPTGIKRDVGFFAALHPDCSSGGDAVVRVVKQPQNGAVEIEPGGGHTNFDKKNQRYACNEKLSQGTKISYTSKQGFVGNDTFQVEIFGPFGGHVLWEYTVTVK